MKLPNESPIYEFMLKNKTSDIETKRKALFSGGMTVLNNELESVLKNIAKTYKDQLSVNALNAVADGSITLFYATDMANALPSYMPFIKYKTKDGKAKMSIDLTPHEIGRAHG